ncbi:MAG: hypothetical protein QOI63_542 [Thermoplasmata archaeon]|jgi:hypothetical protein|nr:hypothetical protein [Thermoplasmata archaeon]
MRARGLALLPLLLLLPAPCASAATTSYVPSLVLDGTVPAYVAGTVAGAEVTLAIGASSATKLAAADTVSLELAGLKEGLHEWTLSILAANVTTTTHGYVMVDTRLEDIYTALALDRAEPRSASAIGNLTAALHALEAKLRADQARLQGNLTARMSLLPGQVGQNVTVYVEGNASAAGAKVTLANPALQKDMQRIQAATAQTETVARGARSYGLWATAAVVALAALLLPLNAIVVLQARKARREALVFLLALAARSGVTPDSPEFQQALAAFDGKGPKRAKAKATAPAGGSA